jgi:hypothetical protein
LQLLAPDLDLSVPGKMRAERHPRSVPRYHWKRVRLRVAKDVRVDMILEIGRVGI